MKMITMKANSLFYGLLACCLLLSACAEHQALPDTAPAIQNDDRPATPAQPLIWSRDPIAVPDDQGTPPGLGAPPPEALQYSTTLKKTAASRAGAGLSEEKADAPAPADKAFPHQARFHPLIEKVSDEAGLDVHLLHAMIEVESGYRPHAVSPKGATGLLQVMPKTGRRFGAHDLTNPEHNLRAGASYMKWLLGYFDNDMRLALAAYNAGEGSVVKYGRKIPPYPETRNYVKKVLTRYRQRSARDAADTAPQDTVTPKPEPVAAPSSPPLPGLAQNLLALLVSAPARPATEAAAAAEVAAAAPAAAAAAAAAATR